MKRKVGNKNGRTRLYINRNFQRKGKGNRIIISMTRFLRYTWPIIAYFFLWLILIRIPTDTDYLELPDIFEFIPHPSILLFNLGGIYYLQTSPFGKTRNTALSIVLICRLIIHSHFWFGSNINGILHISIELFLLIFYGLRTIEKNELKLDAFIKLIFIVSLTLETIETYLMGVIFHDLWPEYIERLLDDHIRNYLFYIVFVFGFISMLLHITMLFKRKDNLFDSQEEKLIEDLGKGTA